jgi:hypothetical protein
MKTMKTSTQYQCINRKCNKVYSMKHKWNASFSCVACSTPNMLRTHINKLE